MGLWHFIGWSQNILKWLRAILLWRVSECDAFHTVTGYLRLLLCDEDETVVVDEVAVDILPKGLKGRTVSANGSEYDEKTRKSGTFPTWLSQLMLHFPSRAVHCTQNTSSLALTQLSDFIFCFHQAGACLLVTCLQAVQNFLWKNSSFIWIPTAEPKGWKKKAREKTLRCRSM